MAGSVKVESYRKARGSSPSVYLVRLDGRVVGLLEKFRNTRQDTHPWKAFGPRNGSTQNLLLGVFYQEDGGRKAALEAIIRAATK